MLDERISVLHQAGFVNESERRSLEGVVDVLTVKYGFDRESDVLGSLVTHVAVSMKRMREGEQIEPMPQEALDDVAASEQYPKVQEITREVIGALAVDVPEREREFILVHVGGLVVSSQQEEGEVRA